MSARTGSGWRGAWPLTHFCGLAGLKQTYGRVPNVAGLSPWASRRSSARRPQRRGRGPLLLELYGPRRMRAIFGLPPPRRALAYFWRGARGVSTLPARSAHGAVQAVTLGYARGLDPDVEAAMRAALRAARAAGVGRGGDPGIENVLERSATCSGLGRASRQRLCQIRPSGGRWPPGLRRERRRRGSRIPACGLT